jgi:hypothetical protein
MEVTIPAGSRAQSMPGPNELPQTFETAEPLPARTAWNKLQPRLSRLQTAESIRTQGIYLKGTATNLKPNDPLLIDLRAGGGRLWPVRVLEVTADAVANRTHVRFRPWQNSQQRVLSVAAFAQVTQKVGAPTGTTAKKVTDLLKKLVATIPPEEFVVTLGDVLAELKEIHAGLPTTAKDLEPWLKGIVEELETEHAELLDSLHYEGKIATKTEQRRAGNFFAALAPTPSFLPHSAINLNATLQTSLKSGADVFPRLLTTFRPALGSVLTPALANTSVVAPQEIGVYALRVSGAFFGHNFTDRPLFDDNGHRTGIEHAFLVNTWADLAQPNDKFPSIAMDAEYDQITPSSFMLIDRPGVVVGIENLLIALPGRVVTSHLSIHTVDTTAARALSALGVSAKVTVATISPDWFAENTILAERAKTTAAMLRQTRVYAQSELLPLAEVPLTDPVCTAEIELDGLYDGLKAGRWVVLAGERANLSDTNGVALQGIRSAELAMILSVSHRVALAADKKAPAPGDKTHTFITLSADPSSCYVRETMTLYGNVVKATHGETRKEVLGSGDAGKPMQSFVLKQPPLTFLPAPSAAGAASTLVVRVNEVEWHETDSLAGLSPNDRSFVTKTDDDVNITVIFGNGRNGARPPTGANNITAVYRNGIGQPGNAKAEQINQLTTRPLGVKEVINPLPATGGADREDRDQARENAPLGILTLDRLVSVQDYADFTRTFAGIGKASATKLSDGAHEVVYVTIAGANDIPIDKNSDLYRNLTQALHSLGDPHLPIAVELREMLSLVISAKVRVLPDYAWEFVEPKVRAALLDVFSFARRDLAQDVTRSEVISVIQRVRGVAYVDLDLLVAISESEVEAEITRTTLNAGKGDDSKSFYEKLGAGVEHRITVRSATSDPKAEFSKRLSPSQIAVLSPVLPETLVLTEVPG